MSLEDYIVCVVAAEMPYTFHTEALKAQAVAARSYCLNKLGSGSHKDGADVCTDYSHCQSYVSKEELVTRYGKTTTESIMTKIKNAVKETEGQIITWEGKPALAVFHSSSYKMTESSKNIWGGNVPYLTSVSTPESDRVSTVTLTDSDIATLFASESAVKVNSSGKNGIYITKTDSGRAEYICLSGLAVNAKLLRQEFGFKSLNFEFEEIDGGWRFTVHGYGHGVGMSQYGANEMAKNGSTYDEILRHYYTGVEIAQITQ
jgi:stage II sporulation protein D